MLNWTYLQLTCDYERTMGMYDFVLLFIIAIAGGIVSLIGFVVIVGKRMMQPREELKQKIDNLEAEIRKLKANKDPWLRHRIPERFSRCFITDNGSIP